MEKIVYASSAVHEPSLDDLVELLRLARDRNASLDITGMLIYAHASYLQHLEGPPAAVGAVWESIRRDPRHENVRLFARVAVTERRFAEWSMGFNSPGDVALADSLPGFRPSVDFPLVNADIVADGTIAETILGLYATNPSSAPG